MKTSLLLMGLAMGAGLVGTARAADVTARPHMPGIDSQTLAATSVSGHGVLSALGGLLSGKTQSGNDTQACDSDAHSASGKSKRHPQPPGPTPLQAAGQHTRAPSTGTNPPPAATASGGDQPPADTSQPTLGWQSLLPGSIQ